MENETWEVFIESLLTLIIGPVWSPSNNKSRVGGRDQGRDSGARSCSQNLSSDASLDTAMLK